VLKVPVPPNERREQARERVRRYRGPRHAYREEADGHGRTSWQL
jgi:hypothetical protein